MPAKDIYHDTVKNALIKDGWTITDDPLSLKIGKKDIFIDLAAEKLLIAEKKSSKIAVEVKSFVGTSEIEDLKNALGQYILYEKILKHQLSERLHSCLIHLEIINKKVWIQCDNTEEGIANDLVRAGIPKSDIVLTFHPPDVRQFTEFAVS